MKINRDILIKASNMGAKADPHPKIKQNEASSTFIFLGPVARKGLFVKGEDISISAWCASWPDVKRRLEVAGYNVKHLIARACQSHGNKTKKNWKVEI